MSRPQLSVEKRGGKFILLNSINLIYSSLNFACTYVIREWANCSSHRRLASIGAPKRTLIFHLKSPTQLTQDWVACVTLAVLTVLWILVPSDLTISMELNHFYKANIFSSSQKIPRILLNPNFHHHFSSRNKTNKCMYVKCVHHILFITNMFELPACPSSG